MLPTKPASGPTFDTRPTVPPLLAKLHSCNRMLQFSTSPVLILASLSVVTQLEHVEDGARPLALQSLTLNVEPS
jgi:hypothetical protein